MSSPPVKSKPGKMPFLAFATDPRDVETLKTFAESRQNAASCVHEGTITQAIEYLKSNPSPQLLLVEITSAREAPDQLNGLADACDPDTKVIVAGEVNEYSFYCWLTEIGVSSYLLKPLSQAALDAAYTKALEPPAVGGAKGKPPARVFGVTSTRGGVGATSVAIYLAGILAENPAHKVALVDLDPQDGSIALLLDLEPSRGMREALERPDRIDNLFLDRVMNKTESGIAVLSSEESLSERINAGEQAAEMLLNEMREKFDIVIIDLPRQVHNPFFRAVYRACETVYIVTDMTLTSMRDGIRLNDLMKDTLKLKPPVFIANRVGQHEKFEVSAGDYEKGIKGKLDYRIPPSPDVFMTITHELKALKDKSAAMKELRRIAHDIVPEEASAEGEESKKPLLGFLKKGK